MQRALRHIPNLLTLARMALLWPFLVCLIEGRLAASLGILCLAAVTDTLDGFLARHFDWRTRLGSVLDPLADKVMIVVSYVSLTWLGILPLWFCVVVLLRDLVVLGGSLAYWRLVGEMEGNPTWLGKLTTALAMGTAVLALFDRAFFSVPASLLWAAFDGVVVVALLSTLQYLRFGWRAWRSARGDV